MIILFTLMSCQSKQEKLTGHWHEYKSDNPENYINCYRISDSLIVINSWSDEDSNGYRRGEDIDLHKIPSWSNGYWEETSKFKIFNDKLIFSDSVHWKKTTNKAQYFYEDFSIGLHIKISPFESASSNFDFQKNIDYPLSYIYIGKIKSSLSKEFETLNMNKYYMQLNDKLVDIEDLAGYIICNHCDMSRSYFAIHADKNTPKEYLYQIENEMLKYGILKKHIYYLAINPEKLTFGYNHSY